jgi:hypothetical protein
MTPDQFASFINTNQPAGMVPGGPQPTQFSPMVNGQQGGMEPSPTQDPMVIQDRASRWNALATQMMTNPALQQALLFGGAAMMQPPQWGDTAGSIIGRGVTTGASAYNLQELAQFEQGMKQRQETRQQTESDARVAESKARTEGQGLENEKTRATMDDAIKKIQLEVQGAEVALGSAKDEAERKKIQLETDRRIKAIKDAIPDAKMRESIEAELAAKGIENKLKTDQAGAARAASFYSYQAGRNQEANAEEQRIINKAMDLLSPEEKKRLVQRKVGVTQTAKEAEASVYSDLWDRMNPGKKDDVAKAKFVDERLSRGKSDEQVYLDILRITGDPDMALAEYRKVMSARGSGGQMAKDLSKLDGKPAVFGDETTEAQYKDDKYLPEGMGRLKDGVVIYKHGGKLYYTTPEKWKAMGQ